MIISFIYVLFFLLFFVISRWAEDYVRTWLCVFIAEARYISIFKKKNINLHNMVHHPWSSNLNSRIVVP